MDKPALMPTNWAAPGQPTNFAANAPLPKEANAEWKKRENSLKMQEMRV